MPRGAFELSSASQLAIGLTLRGVKRDSSHCADSGGFHRLDVGEPLRGSSMKPQCCEVKFSLPDNDRLFRLPVARVPMLHRLLSQQGTVLM